jgi:hypothetical protein
MIAASNVVSAGHGWVLAADRLGIVAAHERDLAGDSERN